MARTRAADFEEKQRVILDHAAQVFADQGMEKASMSQIATVAQVSKALLYHYYPSKDALIFAIITTHLEGLDAAIEEADDPTLPPQQRLRKLVGAVLEAALQRRVIVVDGFITGAAVLVAQALQPQVAQRCVASHESAEPASPEARSSGMPIAATGMSNASSTP